MKKFFVILAGVVVGLVLTCCDTKTEIYCFKHHKNFSELTDLKCEEYEVLAVCEVYALAQESGSFSRISYRDGVVTIEDYMGKHEHVVPVRCDADKKLKAVVGVISEKGSFGLLMESTSLMGTSIINCYDVTLEDLKKKGIVK